MYYTDDPSDPQQIKLVHRFSGKVLSTLATALTNTLQTLQTNTHLQLLRHSDTYYTKMPTLQEHTGVSCSHQHSSLDQR